MKFNDMTTCYKDQLIKNYGCKKLIGKFGQSMAALICQHNQLVEKWPMADCYAQLICWLLPIIGSC